MTDPQAHRIQDPPAPGTTPEPIRDPRSEDDGQLPNPDAPSEINDEEEEDQHPFSL